MTKAKIYNFGCRVNAAESNQFAQKLIDQNKKNIIFVNTCAITQKGEYESLAKVRKLSKLYPGHQIIVSGCADLSKISRLQNITIFKDKDRLSPVYTPKIKDKFSHSQKYLLKIQSGCSQNCSYCIVPQKRPQPWSLPIDRAIETVNTAVTNGYREIIITGVNIAQYQYDLNKLLKSILIKTSIPLISFGSLPLLSINSQFIKLIIQNQFRFSNFLHVPIQSGSDKILHLMHRPYNTQIIIQTFNRLKTISPLVKGGIKGGFNFGTDIIVGFPSETDQDFEATYNLCQQIGFSKIHTFRFSPRPNTKAEKLHLKFPVKPSVVNSRSRQIRSLVI